MSNYISENQSPSEVFYRFRDQVPEFMQTWLEQVVNKAQDVNELEDSIYRTSVTHEKEVKKLKQEIRRMQDILNENDIDF